MRAVTENSSWTRRWNMSIEDALESGGRAGAVVETNDFKRAYEAFAATDAEFKGD